MQFARKKISTSRNVISLSFSLYVRIENKKKKTTTKNEKENAKIYSNMLFPNKIYTQCIKTKKKQQKNNNVLQDRSGTYNSQ